ncbi:unnamed protein product [Sphagnum balticum]
MPRAGPPVVQQQVASEPVVAAASRRRCRTTRPPVLGMVVVERRIVDVAATSLPAHPTSLLSLSLDLASSSRALYPASSSIALLLHMSCCTTAEA